MQAYLPARQDQDAVPRGGDMRRPRDRRADDEAIAQVEDLQAGVRGTGQGDRGREDGARDVGEGDGGGGMRRRRRERVSARV